MKQLRKSCLAVLLLLSILASLSVAAFAAEPRRVSTPIELYQYLQEQYLALSPEFSFIYDGNPRDLADSNGQVSMADLSRAATAILPEQGTSDVAMLNVYDLSLDGKDGVYTLKVRYLVDREREDYVNQRIKEILQTLQLDDASDFVKIKTIYQYMGSSFTYDKTLTKFSDYEGLTTGSMVCQGYALLTYKLMHAVGIPCRIVVGTSQNQPHGWNIVKLNGKWYNLDTTWDSMGDSKTTYWNYFLKSDADFSDHVRDHWFASSKFTEACPMATESYKVSSVTVTLDDQIYSSLIIRNGKSYQLGALLNPENPLPIQWSSSDPAVVSVSETGLLESLTPGDVIITATAEDKTYLPGTFPVTAVDLNSCSAWASEELNSYYLRKLYPAALCSDYRSAINRAEYANLIGLMVQLLDEGGRYQVPGFTDIEDSPYWYYIIFCSGRGIFNGTSDTTFSPEMELTREQAAKILCTMLDFLKIDFGSGEAKTFADEGAISEWAKPYVARMTAAGLMQGDGTNFNPKQTITREQAGVVLERIYVQFIEPLVNAKAA